MAQPQQDLSPLEELLLMKLALIGGLMLVGAVFTVSTWHQVLGWLVEHQVLLAATDAPLLELPGGDGVGLDVRRIAIAAAAVVLALLAAVTSVRNYLARTAPSTGGRNQAGGGR